MKQKQTTNYSKIKSKFIAMSAMFMGVILLGACSYYENVTMDDLNVFKDPDPIYCPSVSILGKSERITVFKDGPGRDITDIITEATMVDFAANCINRLNKESGTGKVIVQLAVGFTASRGPANVEGRYTLPYFVTIMDKNKNILNKENFDIKSVFEGNRYKVSGLDDPITLTIPIVTPLTGQDFIIYIGFQLTPEQLKYNQHSG